MRKQVGVQMEPELYDWLKSCALKSGRTIADELDGILRYAKGLVEVEPVVSVSKLLPPPPIVTKGVDIISTRVPALAGDFKEVYKSEPINNTTENKPEPIDPRAAWFAKTGFKPDAFGKPKPKPRAVDLNKYPNFGDE